MKDKLWFNGKRDERMESLAKRVAYRDSDAEAKMAKLKMAGIHIGEYRAIAEFENGIKIMEYSHDGLVDSDKDWTITPCEYELELEEDEIIQKTDKTYRVYGAGDKLERKNFRLATKYPYGLFELVRDMPYYDAGYMHLQLEDTGFRMYNPSHHNALFISDEGKILVDESDLHYERGFAQFPLNPDWYYDSIKRIRQPLIDHIIKHGPETEMIGNRAEKTYSKMDYSDIGYVYTYINCINNRNNKYQLMTMGYKRDVAFVLFDLETGEVLHTRNGVNLIYTRYGIGLPADDKLIFFSKYRDKLFEYKTDTSIFEYVRHNWERYGNYLERLSQISLKISNLEKEINNHKLLEAV